MTDEMEMSPTEASADGTPDADAQGVCRTVEDFYGRKARQTIGRLLAEFCVRNKATVTELLHSIDLLRRLENSDMALMHAVQKQAAAVATACNQPIRDTVAQLDRLIGKGIEKVAADTRNKLFVPVSAEEFGPLAVALTMRADGAYLLDGALTVLLDQTDWSEKVRRLCGVLDRAGPDGPGKTMLTDAIDEILSEIMRTQAAVLECLGKRGNFGETVRAELLLHLGRYETPEPGNALTPLSKRFAKGELPNARRELGLRILADLKSLNRLRDDSIDDEMQDFRVIAGLAKQAQGPFLPKRDTIEVLELRAARFVAPDVLGRNLENKILPEDKVAWLFTAESCIVGARSRYKIADLVFRQITAEMFRTRMASTQIPQEKRLRVLAELNAKALQSGFDADQKKKMADTFDAMAFDIAKQAKLFESIEAIPEHSSLKVQAVIKLFLDGLVTTGNFSQTARNVILENLAKPGFLTGYLEQCAKMQPADRKLDKAAAILDLIRKLQKAGLRPETILGALAV